MKKFYYTIGEVSNLLGVKPHVIRYWESEFPVLRPKKASGRIRKFSEEHILLLRKIYDLLYNQRFTIEGARQKIKQERDTIKAINAEAEPSAPEQSYSPDMLGVLGSVRSELIKLQQICKQYIGK